MIISSPIILHISPLGVPAASVKDNPSQNSRTSVQRCGPKSSLYNVRFLKASARFLCTVQNLYWEPSGFLAGLPSLSANFGTSDYTGGLMINPSSSTEEHVVDCDRNRLQP